MLSNLINHYQTSRSLHETAGTSEQPQTMVPHSDAANVGDTDRKAGLSMQAGDYRPSDRALLISALALDYDANNLDPKSMGALNSELLDLGLISQKESMLLMKMKAQMPNVDHETLPYQSQQALNQLNRLIENLATARQSMSGVQEARRFSA